MIVHVAAALLSAGLASGSGARAQEAAARPAPPASPARAFRSATELVALQVSVLDAKQKYVAGLRAEDFGVFEEGAPQTVKLFASASSPLDVMILLDTSSSMSGRMEIAQRAAIAFVRELRPEDRAAVILFSSVVRVAHALTGDVTTLEKAIRSAVPRGGTALYEAVYISLREFARVAKGDDQLRRQALVVLSDGDDTASHLSFEDVQGEARRSGVTIFTVVPALDLLVPFERDNGRRAPVPFPLRALAEESGGRAFAPARLDDLSGTYAEIADELGQQYWLAYAPQASGGGFRRISVQVLTRPGLRVRTRAGYYASPPRPARQ